MHGAITRRSCLLGGAAGSLLPGPRAAGRQPNVLWIFAEDMSPQLGCYGEPLIQTPNLDRMAKEGVRFQHAFTPAPVCSASRSAMLTGMYQTAMGWHNHRTIDKKPLPEGVRLISDRMREAGYFTALCSAGPGKRQGPTGSKGSGKTDFNFTAAKPFDGFDWSQRPSGKPFFAHLSLAESHKGPGWPLARKLTPRIDPQRIQLPPYWPDHPIARDEYANYLEAIQLVDREVGEIFERLEREKLAENTLVFFLGDNGSCTFRGKQFLYEGGIRVPLLARWPGRLAAGGVRQDLINGVDLAAATLAAAGVEPPRSLHGRDFLSPGAQGRTHVFTARDRCDIATERMRSVRDARYKYIRNFLPAIPYMQRNPYKEQQYPAWNLVKRLKTEGKLTPAQALFTAESKPVEELYDLETDPHEIRNLAGEAAHEERLKSMRRMVDDWIAEVGDKGAAMEDPVAIYQSYFKGAKW